MTVDRCYHGGRLWTKINEDFSNFNEIIDADVNDAYYSPAPRVIEKIREMVSNINHTPDVYNQKLKANLSKKLGFSEETICMGNGSSELSYAVFGSLLERGDQAAILNPTYGEYERAFRVLGVRCNKISLDEKKSFIVDEKEILEVVKETDAKALIICNPNNPTGTFIEKKQLLKILGNLESDQYLIIDEAYSEYLKPNQSLAELAHEFPNLVVLKTFSKCFALGGLRVGYCTADKKITKKIEERLPPWNVNILAQAAVNEILKSQEYYEQKIKETLKIKEEFFKELEGIPKIKPFKSSTNFILIKLTGSHTSAEVCKKMADKNILIRNCDSFGDEFKEKFIRITVRKPEQNRKILGALKEALK